MLSGCPSYKLNTLSFQTTHVQIGYWVIVSEELRLQLSQHDNLKNIIYISTEVEKIIFEIELNYIH